MAPLGRNRQSDSTAVVSEAIRPVWFGLMVFRLLARGSGAAFFFSLPRLKGFLDGSSERAGWNSKLVLDLRGEIFAGDDVEMGAKLDDLWKEAVSPVREGFDGRQLARMKADGEPMDIRFSVDREGSIPGLVPEMREAFT